MVKVHSAKKWTDRGELMKTKLVTVTVVIVLRKRRLKTVTVRVGHFSLKGKRAD